MSSLDVACSQANGWKESMDKLNGAMASLGFDETAELTSKVAAAMSVFSAMVQLTAITRSAMAVLNRRLAAEVIGEVAAHSLNPIGWAKIGLAVGGAVAAAAVCNALVSHASVQSDLSTPSGRTAAAQTVEALA